MESIRRFPLNALKFFFCVGKYGGLAAAAEQSCVTHGAVSKQLKILEEHVGEALFFKQGRALRLSPAGLKLYESCQYMFAELDNTLAKLKHSQERDLVVSCEPTLAMKWLIPRITHFPKEYGFHVVILAAGGQVDFQRQAVDVAIRRNDFAWPETVFAEYLCAEKTGPVHIPEPLYLKKLHTHTRPDAWSRWEKQYAGAELPYEGDMFFEHFYLSIQAAVAGLGVAVASELMVDEEIRRGILAAPHGFQDDGSAYYLLSDIPFEADCRRQKFLSWLKEQMHSAVVGA